MITEPPLSKYPSFLKNPPSPYKVHAQHMTIGYINICNNTMYPMSGLSLALSPMLPVASIDTTSDVAK
jgi:hypothetical protein